MSGISSIYANIDVLKPFGKKLTGELVKITENVVFVAIGTIISAFSMLLFNVIAARLLGPTDYGTLSVIQAMSMLIYVPMMFGYGTASVKCISAENDVDKRASYISATMLTILCTTTLFSIIYWLFSGQISSLLKVSSDVFSLSVVLTIFYSLYIVTSNFFRGLLKLKLFSIIMVLQAVLSLLIFVIFLLRGYTSYTYAVYSIAISYLIIILLIVSYLHRYFISGFSWDIIQELTTFNIYYFISGLSFAIYTNADKIIINAFLNPKELGIYTMYVLVVTNVVNIVTLTFSNTLFPIVSNSKNKYQIISSITYFMPVIAIVVFIAIIIGEFIITIFYGNQYPFYINYAILFGLSGIFILLSNTYAWLMSAYGKRGSKIISMSSIVVAIVNILANLLLIPILGITGAIIAAIISYMAYLGLLYANRAIYQTDQ